MTGRIIVHHAISRPLLNSISPEGTGLPSGVRRDAVLSHPELSTLLSDPDKARWNRQSLATGTRSETNKRLEDAKRSLARARKTPGVDLDPYLAAFNEAQELVDALKKGPEFQHTIQRPIPVKWAAPAGTVYDHAIELVDASNEEAGLLLASLQNWTILPRIGGGRTVGYGQIEAAYTISALTHTVLRRDRKWEVVGSLIIDSETTPIESDHPVIHLAIRSWRAMEADIMTATAIFK